MEQDEAEEEFFERRRRRRADLDWFLQFVVRLADSVRAERYVNMTLLVGGSIVSGDLVGGSVYFEGVATELASATDNKDAAAALKDFR